MLVGGLIEINKLKKKMRSFYARLQLYEGRHNKKTHIYTMTAHFTMGRVNYVYPKRGGVALLQLLYYKTVAEVGRTKKNHTYIVVFLLKVHILIRTGDIFI